MRPMPGTGASAETGCTQSESDVRAAAVELARALPEVMRTLFALDPGQRLARLPLAQIRLLGVLGQGPCTVTAAGADLGISASAATQLADRMQRAGLLERAPASADRRMRLLRLTPAGLDALESRRASREAAALAALRRMPECDRHQLLASLRALRAVARTPEAGAPPARQAE